MSEKAPLLHYRLTTSPGRRAKDVSTHSGVTAGRDGRRPKEKSVKKLGVFFGVVIPTLLSMFSVVVFLRIGE